MGFDTLEIEVRILIHDTSSSDRSSAFGRGIVELCEWVERTGSLNKACKQMGMAYSKAWRIIRNTEQTMGVELLNRQGANGSTLTEEARKLVHLFRYAEADLKAKAADTLKEALAEEDER